MFAGSHVRRMTWVLRALSLRASISWSASPVTSITKSNLRIVANSYVSSANHTNKEYADLLGITLDEMKIYVDTIKDLVAMSNDAGKFVCNNIYYHLLFNYPEKSLFIHIPECNNDTMKYREYAEKIEKLILTLGGVL